MAPATTRRGYRTYLLRCWEREPPQSAHEAWDRYVVERVSDEPERWVFSTFAEMIEFLGRELGARRPTAPPDQQ